MTGQKRFIKTENLGGTWFIKDSKDASLVCIIQKGQRPLEHTEAMVKVMLAALNNAVERKNG